MPREAAREAATSGPDVGPLHALLAELARAHEAPPFSPKLGLKLLLLVADREAAQPTVAWSRRIQALRSPAPRAGRPLTHAVPSDVLDLPRSLALALTFVLLPACSDDPAGQAKAKARDLSEQTADKGKQLAGDLATDLSDKAKHKADELWAERPQSGDLSERAKALLAKGSAASGDGVEALLGKGEQLAPLAVDVAKTLSGAIDGEVDIEPIVQKLDDPEAQAELDERIKDMPRVETIDGVDVGFKDMTQWDSGGRETESAYLILWRHDERLLGLVYRSRKRIDVEKLIAEAPRLLALVRGVL